MIEYIDANDSDKYAPRKIRSPSIFPAGVKKPRVYERRIVAGDRFCAIGFRIIFHVDLSGENERTPDSL